MNLKPHTHGTQLETRNATTKTEQNRVKRFNGQPQKSTKKTWLRDAIQFQNFTLFMFYFYFMLIIAGGMCLHHMYKSGIVYSQTFQVVQRNFKSMRMCVWVEIDEFPALQFSVDFSFQHLLLNVLLWLLHQMIGDMSVCVLCIWMCGERYSLCLIPLLCQR